MNRLLALAVLSGFASSPAAFAGTATAPNGGGGARIACGMVQSGAVK